MSSIFISYRHVEPDAALAVQVADALTADGHSVFIDTRIPPGREWGDLIEKELAEADWLIAIISQASAASPMVVTEIAEAHRLNVKRGRPGIMPLRVGEGFPLRYPLSAYLSRFQQVTWTGPAHTEPLIGMIKEALAMPRTRRSVASQRGELIQRVRGDWISGVLETSLHHVARIELDLQLDEGAVKRGLDVLVQRPLEPPQPLFSATPLLQVFDDHRGQLLILGAPGSGKTTLLLELARDLLQRAEHDEEHAIPVVFNLSSWALERPTLDQWMIEELHLRSDAPRKLAREWVEHEQILPLLDGLDEVPAEHRAQCVSAINAFRKDHGWTPIVVCSRKAEYESLSEVLALPCAVVVQPLRRQQLEEYLARAGDKLAGVRAALKADPSLWDLLESPLMLSVFALAYRDQADVPDGLGEEQLVRQYVNAMFRRRAKEHRYAEGDMRAWLHWLAVKQVARAQTVFFLEDLVPERFLSTRAEWAVNATVVAITTAVATLWLSYVLWAWEVSTSNELLRASPDDIRLYTWFGAPVGLLLGLLHGRRAGPIDALQVQFPGWKAFLGHTVRGAALGSVLGGFLGYAGCLATVGLEYGLVLPAWTAAMFAIIGCIALGLLYAMRTVLVPRMLGQRGQPGLLIRRSALSAGVIIAASLVPLVTFAAFEQALDGAGSVALLYWVSWVGLFFGLERGGYFLLRHYMVRVWVWAARHGPWHYTNFLDVATERLLLRRVGGGYIFVHRKLMEHLANPSSPLSPAVAAATG